MQAGGGWFVPWTMGMQKFAVALPMGGVVPLVPPLLAALPPAPPPLRLIAPPPLPHQSQIGRKGEKDNGKNCILSCEKRKADDSDLNKDLKKCSYWISGLVNQESAPYQTKDQPETSEAEQNESDQQTHSFKPAENPVCQDPETSQPDNVPTCDKSDSSFVLTFPK